MGASMFEYTRLNETEQAFVKWQRVARLATADAEGHPHVIPVCYAFDGRCFYIPLDEKPKRVDDMQLRRVRNILERPEASLVIDQYDDEWSQIGYILISARAGLLYPQAYRPEADLNGASRPPELELPAEIDRVGLHRQVLKLLRERYFQYRSMQLETRPLIVLVPLRVVSWGPALQGH